MKIAVTIVRSLVGALFIFASVTFLFKLITPPEMTGNMKTFNEGLAASGYLMQLVKVTELICGIALLSNRFVPMALVILSPIIINIFFVHLLLDQSGLPVGIFLTVANGFLGYSYRDSFSGLFKAKTNPAA